MRRLLVLSVGLVLLGGVAVRARASGAGSTWPTSANHQCPSVPTFNAVTGIGHGPEIRLFTRKTSCSDALGIVRAMISGVGVTFSGSPTVLEHGPAAEFRWKLYGLPGWTCYGDGSGFPEGGAGGICGNGGATVEWYHASRSN